jgi:hypothetical protein
MLAALSQPGISRRFRSPKRPRTACTWTSWTLTPRPLSDWCPWGHRSWLSTRLESATTAGRSCKTQKAMSSALRTGVSLAERVKRPRRSRCTFDPPMRSQGGDRIRRGRPRARSEQPVGPGMPGALLRPVPGGDRRVRPVFGVRVLCLSLAPLWHARQLAPVAPRWRRNEPNGIATNTCRARGFHHSRATPFTATIRPPAGALVPRSSNPDVPVNRENTSVVQCLRSTEPPAGAAAPGRVDVAIYRSTLRLT